MDLTRAEAVRIGPAPSGRRVVGLLAQASYHLDEFVPLRDELVGRGIEAEVLVLVPPRKPLNRFRPGVRRFSELLARSVEPAGAPIPLADLTTCHVGLVVMNDWGTPRPLVEEMKREGRPTFGWVEGAQDYDDLDTGQDRRAYRRVDHVLCIGAHDVENLPSADTTIVGSTRLRALWNAESQVVTVPHTVVNSNFTYGVLAAARRPWLRSVKEACREAGVDWSLSRHAAERRINISPRASPEPVGELLARSTHLVSRFSTLCYEALVRGVELVYHNPHGETVPTFAAPEGAFEITRSANELAAALARPPRAAPAVRRSATAFLSHHLRLDDGLPPAVLAADVISAALA